jgi:hypothetical protein
VPTCVLCDIRKWVCFRVQPNVRLTGDVALWMGCLRVRQPKRNARGNWDRHGLCQEFEVGCEEISGGTECVSPARGKGCGSETASKHMMERW